MAKQRINITVDEKVFRLLSEMDNHSDYLTRLVDHHDQQWRGALLTLRGRGWRNDDVLALVDKMTGYHPPGLPARVVVCNVINRICGPLPPSPRWEEALKELEAHEGGPELARMICILAADYWAGNTILRRELGAT